MHRKTLLSLFSCLFFCLFLSTQNIVGQSKIWVGSWSCAPYESGSNTPPSPYLANNSLRQIVRVSIGGDTIRLKFSNKTCGSSLTMNSVTVAISTGGSNIDVSTIKQLKFNGNTTATIDPNGSLTSDPVAFNLAPNARVAITIYYGQASSSADATSHAGSRTDSYLLAGDGTTSPDFAGSVVTAHWFTINTIDVKAAQTAGCVAVLGNSITDGYGISGGTQNRWTDMFSQKLLNNTKTQDVGVLNLGIGATNVSGTGTTTGATRYKKDILAQSGLRWVIIFYGTNDINGGASAATITGAFQKMIDDAHALNLKVYGATITPFNGNSYYTVAHEAVRNEVNNWIKTAGHYDGYLDFDKVIQDPANTIKMLDIYANDYLHPNILGYKTLGESIDTTLFQERTVMAQTTANAGVDQTVITNGNVTSATVNLDGSASYDFGDLMASYTWKEGSETIATGVNPSVDLSIGIHTLSLMVVGSNGSTASDDVTITVVKDAGIWLEAEAGTVGSMWDILSDTNASNSSYVTAKSGNQSKDTAPGSDGQVSYTFNVETSGTYTLWLRVICANADDDSFWLKMDNGSFANWNGVASSSSWIWKSWSTTYSLTAGTHTISIGLREDGAKLDKILITNSGQTPSGIGSTASNLTGVNEVSSTSNTLFPNPVSNNLTINLENPHSTITLYTIGGQKLYTQTAKSTTVSLDMKAFSTGIYLVKITNQNDSKLYRVVKK
jgi:lysophospholipase L1-like esterase